MVFTLEGSADRVGGAWKKVWGMKAQSRALLRNGARAQCPWECYYDAQVDQGEHDRLAQRLEEARLNLQQEIALFQDLLDESLRDRTSKEKYEAWTAQRKKLAEIMNDFEQTAEAYFEAVRQSDRR